MSKKGSILLEIVSGMFVLMITITISISMFINVNKSIANRKNYINQREILYLLCNEIKYNLKFEEIESKLLNKNFRIKYNDDFFEEILTLDLLNFQETTDDKDYIEVKGINFTQDNIKIEIVVCKRGEVLGEVINKSKWMEKI